MTSINRRHFNLGLASLAGTATLVGQQQRASAASYRGPNVIIIRFGGGVRRAETIGANSYAPYLLNTLTKRGVLIPDVRIDNIKGMDTSHAEGTINILTGRYAAWRDADAKVLLPRIEPTAPTLFEYFRKSYNIRSHEVLLINGEDRPQEEFFSFARHRGFGGDFRAEVLSLYRYKRWLYTRLLAEGNKDEALMKQLAANLEKIERHELPGRTPKANKRLSAFWSGWRADYGEHGFINPRGDRLLTTLALRAMRNLQPRLMMINYQDPDYVHWGNASHYTRAISIIDEGVRQLINTADNLEFYSGRTIFIIIPDCGRDSNSLLNIPYQHHFNTRSAHEIWALIVGPGITTGRTLDKVIDQSQIAATVGAIMGFKANYAEGAAIDEVFV